MEHFLNDLKYEHFRGQIKIILSGFNQNIQYFFFKKIMFYNRNAVKQYLREN